ncbi:MAG: TonB-dependent receptor, partial [Acidobacteriota bacterium]|nr:TonB-dependent receptor [Acidobacteriota bacterium]
TEPFPLSNLPYWPEIDTSRNQFATIEERHIFSPNLVGLFRFSFSRPLETGAAAGSIPEFNYYNGAAPDGTLNITGVNTTANPLTGGGFTTPFNLVVNRFNEAGNFIWTHGSHTIKVGASLLRRDSNTRAGDSNGGMWQFNSLALFLQASPSLFRGKVPGPQYSNRDVREIQIEPYFQDDWKISSTLTLNLGLRYEFVSNPTEIRNNLYVITDPATGSGFTNVPNVFINGNPSKWNFDPRFGLAWDPFKDHKTSFRAGFGIYHDMILYPYLYGLWTQPPSLTATVTNPQGFPVPFAGSTLPPPSPSQGFDSRINHTPYQMQWNFNIQRQVMSNTTLTVAYQGARGVHLMTAFDENPVKPVCCASNGRLQFATITNGRITAFSRTNPNYGLLLMANANGVSNYHGLQVGLARRFTKNLTYQVSYTYSHSLDNGSAGTGGESQNNGGAQNPFDSRSDYSNSSFDVRHSLRINAVYAFPFHGNKLVEGWQLSGIQAAQTGVPVTVTTGFDQIGNGQSGYARPDVNPNCTNLVLGTTAHWYNPACFVVPVVGTPGNSARTSVPGPHFVSADLSLSKDTKIPKISETFGIQFRAEVFNVFNHANYGLPSSGAFTQSIVKDSSGNSVLTGVVSPTAGKITSIIGTPRQIQFGLKIVF